MSRPRRCLCSLACLALCLVASSVRARAESPDVSGDVRLRLEADWDSRRPDGSARQDRTRARVRLRLAWARTFGERWSARVRLRTGARQSQQSPHLTVHEFDSGDLVAQDLREGEIGLDLAYFERRLEAAGRGSAVSLGRVALPFWKQNELIWDDDVTVTGVGWRTDFGSGQGGAVHGSGEHGGRGPGWQLRAGYFALPAGLDQISGRLATLQGAVSTAAWTLALGALALDADPSDPDGARLLDGNGSRDYRLLVASGQLRRRLAGRPLVLGLDAVVNLERLAATSADPFTARHADDTEGLVLSAGWGSAGWGRAGRRWQLGATWARIEALAVAASYAGDDWHRWGTPTQTRSSHFVGYELRAVRALSPRARLVVRYFDVRGLAVDGFEGRDDARRLRVDWDWRF